VQSLWTGSDDKTVRVWPLADSFQGGPDGVRCDRVLSGHSDSVVSLCVGSGGEHVWSSSAVSSVLHYHAYFASTASTAPIRFCSARESVVLMRAQHRMLSPDPLLPPPGTQGVLKPKLPPNMVEIQPSCKKGVSNLCHGFFARPIR